MDYFAKTLKIFEKTLVYKEIITKMFIKYIIFAFLKKIIRKSEQRRNIPFCIAAC